MQEQIALNTATKVREHSLIINGIEADEETYNRVMNAKPIINRKAKGPQPKPFSILKV